MTHRKFSRRLQRINEKNLFRPIANALGISVGTMLRNYRDSQYSASAHMTRIQMEFRRRVMERQSRQLNEIFNHFINSTPGESLDHQKES